MSLRDFKLIRTRRRTLALQVRPDGTLTVRAPIFMREPDIHQYISKKRSWIEKTAARLKEKAQSFPKVQLDKNEKKKYQENAFMALTLRCQFFAERMQVHYSRILLSDARSRWGSCSPDGRLCFNWRLTLVPTEILDYVVVHELAHLRHLNHSPKFWSEVERWYADWRVAKRWLKDNQDRLTAIS